MKYPIATSSRQGFTLLELSLSIMIVSILMLGLFSSIQLVTSASQTIDGPVSVTTGLTRQIERMSADLRLAQTFLQRSESVVEFTVPDRDGDGVSETIRYEWLESPQRQLQRSVTSSGSPGQPAVTVMAEQVRDFHLDYLTATHGPAEPDAEVESDEMLLMSHDDYPVVYGNRVLFLVSSPQSLTNTDAKKRALMQSWGFVVENMAATESSAALDEAISRNDVIYISESVNSDDLGTKVSQAGIGIVCEEPYLSDELGLASSVGSTTDEQRLSSTVGTHYLTRGWLPGAAVIIATKRQLVQSLSSDSEQQAPDLKVLATRDGQPALCVLEQGGQMLPTVSRAGATESPANLTPSTGFDDKTVATQFTLTELADVDSISAYLRFSWWEKIQFGIYADNDGEPGALIVSTNPQYRYNESGWITRPLADSRRLEPGDYWLAVAMDNGLRLGYEETQGDSRVSSSISGGGLAATWAAASREDAPQARGAIHLIYKTVQFAAARRVMLPWGSMGFDVDCLNDDGRQLMRRALQWAGDLDPRDAGLSADVRNNRWVSQFISPPLPSNATGWKLTRVFCHIKQPSAAAYETIRFRLSSAGLDNQPSAYRLQQADVIFWNNLSAEKFQWYEIPFSVSGDLRTDRGVCLTVQTTANGPALTVQYDDGSTKPTTAGTQLLQSSSQGSSWSSLTAESDLRFYLYGRYLTRGEPQW